MKCRKKESGQEKSPEGLYVLGKPGAQIPYNEMDTLKLTISNSTKMQSYTV